MGLAISEVSKWRSQAQMTPSLPPEYLEDCQQRMGCNARYEGLVQTVWTGQCPRLVR